MEKNEEKENTYFSYSKRKKNKSLVSKLPSTTTTTTTAISNESANSFFPINDLPDDLLDEIFLCLPGKDLCQCVPLVCSRWFHLVSNESFWVQKCLRDNHLNKYLIGKLNEKQIGWNCLAKQIYLSGIFSKNLLVNACGCNSFDDWCFIQNFNLKDLKKSIDFYKSNKIKDSAKWRSEKKDYGFQEILDENSNPVSYRNLDFDY